MHTQVIVGDLDCATQDLPKLRLQFPSFIYKIFPHRVTSLQEKKKKKDTIMSILSILVLILQF